ncbi:hypothetical protein SAMN06295945_1586 [Polynucleobacter meluiroseus]|uniref:Uncharacterized protein n=1 Tax=Polynucleobacter meluiroseus TaxID=1938814 RepID=A0A240E2X3_9BURK|nr:hypothetical protein [Polynucleobacter meluiroseus]SNX29220.1 hypothetical protein SAMN06295945_1586 [Polynucleobacter meluiroseus]
MLSRKFDEIQHLATRYIWWQSAEQTMSWPERLIAQIMDIGDYADVQVLVHAVGDQVLRDVLTNAQAGNFSPRSWHYWHYRLGVVKAGEEMPALPKRKCLPSDYDPYF